MSTTTNCSEAVLTVLGLVVALATPARALDVKAVAPALIAADKAKGEPTNHSPFFAPLPESTIKAGWRLSP